jgi:hypothetical protein
MKKLLLAIILTAGMRVASAQADTLTIALDIQCANPRTQVKFEDAFRAELGKIPDAVIVNLNDPHDLGITVIATPSENGLTAYTTLVNDHVATSKALKKAGLSPNDKSLGNLISLADICTTLLPNANLTGERRLPNHRSKQGSI